MTAADVASFYQIAERLGVPVAFALLMVVLLIFFARMHRAERGEWRVFTGEENKLNRATIDKLSEAVNHLAIKSAFQAGANAAQHPTAITVPSGSQGVN